ncbi:unnamed protein product, partial [marine sediment metagenome]
GQNGFGFIGKQWIVRGDFFPECHPRRNDGGRIDIDTEDVVADNRQSLVSRERLSGDNPVKNTGEKNTIAASGIENSWTARRANRQAVG